MILWTLRIFFFLNSGEIIRYWIIYTTLKILIIRRLIIRGKKEKKNSNSRKCLRSVLNSLKRLTEVGSVHNIARVLPLVAPLTSTIAASNPM